MIAFRARWNRSNLEDLEKRIESFRQQLFLVFSSPSGVYLLCLSVSGPFGHELTDLETLRCSHLIIRRPFFKDLTA